MKIKALVLGYGENTEYLSNVLIAKGIEPAKLYELPETLNLIKQENYDFAVVEDSISDIDSVCFRLIWACRIRVAVVLRDPQSDVDSLRNIGVEDFVFLNAYEEELEKTLSDIAHKGSYKFGKIKVAVIEDDKHIREAIRLFFKIYWPEADVEFAAGGEDGVKLVKNKNRDIVLLDLGLPDISGFEVLNWIRNFSDIPIIILTAAHEKELVIKAIQSGANDYVVKPFKQMDLMPRIRKYIEMVSLMR
jgi:CheY-like chemotaxis protein